MNPFAAMARRMSFEMLLFPSDCGVCQVTVNQLLHFGGHVSCSRCDDRSGHLTDAGARRAWRNGHICRRPAPPASPHRPASLHDGAREALWAQVAHKPRLAALLVEIERPKQTREDPPWSN